MQPKQIKEQLPYNVYDRIQKKENVTIVDVREPNEWIAGHIPGAKHIPLGQITERLHEIDAEKETIIVCRSGNRSGMACQHLSSLGYNVVNMPGGMSEWFWDVEYGQ